MNRIVDKRTYEAVPFPRQYQKFCDYKLSRIIPKLRHCSTILDAGCGGEAHPYCFLKLKEEYPKLIGCDLNSHWHPDIKKENILSLSFEDQSFDVVLCLNVLEHIEDWERGLNELIRVARKKVIFTIPTTESWLFSRITDLIRKLIGIHNKIMVGHYWDFTPELICNFNHSRIQHVEFERLVFYSFPLFPRYLYRKKIYYAGLFCLNLKMR